MSEASEKFLNEVLSLCFKDKDFMETTLSNLKYSLIRNENYEKVFQKLDEYRKTDRDFTYGSFSRSFKDDKLILDIIFSIENTNVPKGKIDTLKADLTDFVKELNFVDLFNKSYSEFNDGNKAKAIDNHVKEAIKVSEISLFSNPTYTTVYQGYSDREDKRMDLAMSESMDEEFVPTGIRPLDNVIQGIEKKTAMIAIARSGTGKSTFLRWLGLHTSRLGGLVVHFQAEGKQEHVLREYDSGWTGLRKSHIKNFDISSSRRNKINKALNQILAQKGEIVVKSFEQFDTASIEECRDVLHQVVKDFDRTPDLIIYDYLELFNPTRSYPTITSQQMERLRRSQTSRKIVNTGLEFNSAVATASQAMNIEESDYNNPDFVIRREHISELKNLVNDFSYVLTFNQTEEEKEEEILRLFYDKLRDFPAGYYHYIAQNLDNSRFYDNLKTLKKFPKF